MRGSIIAAVLAATVWGGATEASVVWQIDDDGTGAVRMRLSGTYDVSAGTFSSFSGAQAARFISGGVLSGNLQWSHISTASTGRRLDFNLTSGSGNVLAAGFSSLNVPDTAFDNLRLSAGGSSLPAFMIGFNGVFSGSLSEDVVLPTVAYSNFVPGVSEWGDPSQPNQGIRIEVGQNPVSVVPLPGGLALLAGAFGLAGVIRRRG